MLRSSEGQKFEQDMVEMAWEDLWLRYQMTRRWDHCRLLHVQSCAQAEMT